MIDQKRATFHFPKSMLKELEVIRMRLMVEEGFEAVGKSELIQAVVGSVIDDFRRDPKGSILVRKLREDGVC